MSENYGGVNFSDFLKSMQERCSHPEEEREDLSDVMVICMCCGKMLSFNVEKVLKEIGLVEE